MRKNAQLPKLSDKAATAASLLMFLAMFGFLRVSPTYAQSRASGEIRGTVLDSGGAAVPGVAITIQDELTGVTTKLSSDNSGVFDAASLNPSTYTVTFEKDGFKRFVESGIVLYVEAITVNAVLEVGSVSQQVEVTGGTAPLLQTETSDRSQTITATEVSELPASIVIGWTTPTCCRAPTGR